jgi:hypothetical protein
LGRERLGRNIVGGVKTNRLGINDQVLSTVGIFLAIPRAALVLHEREHWRLGRNVPEELSGVGELIPRDQFDEPIGPWRRDRKQG